MADKGGLQLLPENRKRIDIKIPGENRMIFIGIGLIVVILAVYGVLWFYGQNLSSKISQQDKTLQSQQDKRDNKTEQSLLTISRQLALTNQIIKDHIYWSLGFSRIETAIQDGIQFKSLSAKLGEKNLNIRALATNYTTIAKQISAFNSDASIKDVTLDNASTLTTGKIDFSSKVTFDPEKFLKN